MSESRGPQTVLLDRFTVKPHHLDAWSQLWPDEVGLLGEHGLRVHRAFVETDAEPKVTRLISHPDGAAAAEAALAAARAGGPGVEFARAVAPHVFRNRVTRQVRVEILTDGHTDRTVVMRRYAITGDWGEFLDIWRRIVPVREKYGFGVLFAVADEAHDLFTWAFDMDAPWEEFGAAQRGYYHDDDRVLLRGVFDYMADYALHPARELPLPS